MKSTISSLLFLVLLLSCNGNSSQEPTSSPSESPAQESFSLGQSIIDQEHIALGKPQPQLFSDIVTANGTLKAAPQGEASVASPMGANVRRILVVEGQRVRQGQTLAIVSHPDLLDLQGRYLAASSRMEYVSKEYQRQKTLYASKIGSGKDYQLITSEYRQLQSELNVTGRQLRLLGISPNAVKAGHTVDVIAIKSPINGTVETIGVMVGQYADPQSSLFSIVNTDHVYADLLVYENDLSKVSKGCEVALTSKTSPGKLAGKVVSVGNAFDTNNRAVHVRVAITSGHSQLVPGAYVSAAISGPGSKRLAVSDDALATDGDRTYVFLASKRGKSVVFVPREVKTGQHSNGYSEIVSGLSASDTIAVSGAYMLISEWKKADAEQ